MAQHISAKKPENRYTRDFEVRKLSGSSKFSITKLLDDQSAWRKVMSLVRKDSINAGVCPLKYTAEHIRMIEDAAMKQQRSATAIFFEEWGCSGKKRPTLGNLLDLLIETQLYSAVDFVASELLEEQPPPRPASGPAAKVVWNEENCVGYCSSHQSNAPQPSAPQELCSLGESNGNKSFKNSLIQGVKNDSFSPMSNQSALTNEIYESHRLGQELETLSISKINEQTLTEPIPYHELHIMTNGFNPECKESFLGSGAFGSVFLAHLNDQLVAVKRLNEDIVDIDVSKQFFNEVEALSRIHHPHLLHLIGYSYDGPSYCLVYEYMSHGNLQERLACKGKWEEPLSWMDRIKISLGTAQGLHHLHSFKPFPILHRDVKSCNILLDGQTTPKVGDFGLIRFGSVGKETEVVTTVIGTSAYMAPEVFRGDISKKMDVFSFGVVLLELLSGLPPWDKEREGCDLITHVAEACDNSILPLLDKKAGSWKSATGENIAEDLYSLARRCLVEKKARPEMIIIVETLIDLSLNK